MERSIVHMDLDSFFVSCERLIDSRLYNRPILIGGSSDRGVVASCSYEARAFGIHSAMPMKMARELCPEAIVIRGNSSTYSEYSSMVTEIIKERVPLYEKSSIDEFYIDLTGMDRFFGNFKLASEIRTTIMKETGLPISFGLSANKTVSKIATGEAKPNNQMKIDYGKEKYFLAPLSARKIPMVGVKTFQSLCNLGLRKIETIQKMPIEMMQGAFGKNGIEIWKKANGMDKSLVVPYNEKKSISTERTFDKDTIDVQKLKGILTAMAENLAFQLRNGKKLTACVTVKVRYADFNTHTLQKKIPYTSADHVLIPIVNELFQKLYNKRILVRLVGIRLSHLVAGGNQINLFDDSEKMTSLYQALDTIRNRFGHQKIMRVVGMKSGPMGIMNPFNGESTGNLTPSLRK